MEINTAHILIAFVSTVALGIGLGLTWIIYAKIQNMLVRIRNSWRRKRKRRLIGQRIEPTIK